MAVTGIDYCGRVLPVVSQADVALKSAEISGVVPFMTIMFGGPTGQIT